MSRWRDSTRKPLGTGSSSNPGLRLPGQVTVPTPREGRAGLRTAASLPVGPYRSPSIPLGSFSSRQPLGCGAGCSGNVGCVLVWDCPNSAGLKLRPMGLPSLRRGEAPYGGIARALGVEALLECTSPQFAVRRSGGLNVWTGPLHVPRVEVSSAAFGWSSRRRRHRVPTAAIGVGSSDSPNPSWHRR